MKTRFLRPLTNKIFKFLIIVEALYLIMNAQIALAQDNISASIAPSQVTQAWEAARDGALIGFGTGAAVSLMAFSFNAKDVDYLRIMAGTTGTGFIFGAVYGLVEDRFFPSVAQNKNSRFQPQLFQGPDNILAYGMHASLKF